MDAGAAETGSDGRSGYADARPDDGASRPAPPAACPNVAVARFKELLIVDPSVVRDSRADNGAADRPWSFRARMEALAGDATATGPLVDAWLDQWKTLQAVPVSVAPGAAQLAVTPRSGVDEALRCPWLQRSPSNGCTDACDACRSQRLDMAAAPFRLLAIVNRTDLATGGACGDDGGELRFVYGAVAPDGVTTLPLTVSSNIRSRLPATSRCVFGPRRGTSSALRSWAHRSPPAWRPWWRTASNARRCVAC
jgi:hypothetical protein